jgi:hypothetical protein
VFTAHDSCTPEQVRAYDRLVMVETGRSKVVHRETERGAHDQRHLHIQPILTMDGITPACEGQKVATRLFGVQAPMKDVTMLLGGKIRQLRSDRGWSQRELAARLGGDPGQPFRRRGRLLSQPRVSCHLRCSRSQRLLWLIRLRSRPLPRRRKNWPRG